MLFIDLHIKKIYYAKLHITRKSNNQAQKKPAFTAGFLLCFLNLYSNNPANVADI